jgi:SrtB family sortase
MENKNNNNNIFNNIIKLFAIAILLLSMGILMNKVFNYLYDYKYEKEIRNQVVTNIPKPPRSVPAYPLGTLVSIPNHVMLQKLYSESAAYKDFKFWIYIPSNDPKFEDSIIDYPVAQCLEDTDEKQKYLNTNLEGQGSQSGTIFLDYRNDAITLKGNNIIYGHQMKNETMFGQNYKFANQEYLNSHNIIYLYSIYSASAWQIFSVFHVDNYEEEKDYNGNKVSSYYTSTYFKDVDDYYNFLKYFQAQSLVKTDVELKPTDDIITLSTCETQTGQYARFVIMAKRISSVPMQ